MEICNVSNIRRDLWHIVHILHALKTYSNMDAPGQCLAHPPYQLAYTGDKK